MFSGSWIGQQGTVEWLSRSLEITPLDFYLWGKLKNIVYHEKPTTPDNTKERIITTRTTITSQELNNVHEELIKRFYIKVNRHYFEHW